MWVEIDESYLWSWLLERNVNRLNLAKWKFNELVIDWRESIVVYSEITYYL